MAMNSKQRKAIILASREEKARRDYKPSGIKDIKAGKPSSADTIDTARVGLKIAQAVSSTRRNRKPTMPKMPWSNDDD